MDNEITLLHKNEIQEIIREEYNEKQKYLAEIVSIILDNPSAEVLEKNFLKLRNLIDVAPYTLDFRIKTTNHEEMI